MPGMPASVLRPDANTFLTHVFGRGLEDKTYVVERYRTTIDGEIRRLPGGKGHQLTLSLDTVRELRPARNEILICRCEKKPDYRRVTPAGRMESTLLDLSTLADAVEAASSGARSAGHWPKVTLNGHVTMTAHRDSGIHDEEETLLPIECQVDGDPIAFNGWHLEDAGRAFGRVGTTMRYTKPEHPAVFISPDRPELVVVQMPTRA